MVNAIIIAIGDFIVSGKVVLIFLPFFAVLLDIIYEWSSEGRLPSFVPRMTISALAQAGTVLVISLVVSTRAIPSNQLAFVVGVLFILFCVLIFHAGIVRRTQQITKRWVDDQLSKVTMRYDSDLLTQIRNIGHQIIDVDFDPDSPTRKLSGDDYRVRRQIYVDLLTHVAEHSFQADDFLIPREDRKVWARGYIGLGIASVLLFLVGLVLSVASL